MNITCTNQNNCNEIKLNEFDLEKNIQIKHSILLHSVSELYSFAVN